MKRLRGKCAAVDLVGCDVRDTRYPVTVSEVAKEAGIEDAEDYVDASTLTDEKALFAAAER